MMEYNQNILKAPVINNFNNFSGNFQNFPEDPLWHTGIFETILLSPNKWLKKKAAFDNCGQGKLWRVRNNLYDLVPFIKKHPGGSDWIKITQGQDITELFISSHVINTNIVEKVLKKYYVKPADGPRKSPYTFEENGFYMTFQRKANLILKKIGTNPSLHSRLIHDTLGLAALLSGILGAMANSYILLILSGLLLYCLFACCHNFCHLKDNWRRYFVTIITFPPQDIRIVHCVSHHVFPNTRMDFEAMVMEPLMIHRHVTKYWIQKWGVFLYMHFVFFLGFLANYCLKLHRIFVLKEQGFQIENAVPLIHMILMGLIAPTFTEGIFSWLLMLCVSSYCTLFAGFTAAHHDPTCWHDGDRIRSNPDWGISQLDATRDTPVDFSKNLFLQSITVGEHPLHHLLPTVCHSKYKYLKPILKETMKEFGLEYPKKTRKELVWTSWKNLSKTTPNDFDKDERSH